MALTIPFTLLPARPIQSRGEGAGPQDVEGQLPLCHELSARHRGSEGPEQEQRQLSCAGVPDAPTPHQEPEERYSRTLGAQEALRVGAPLRGGRKGKEGGRQAGNWGWCACTKADSLSAPTERKSKSSRDVKSKAKRKVSVVLSSRPLATCKSGWAVEEMPQQPGLSFSLSAVLRGLQP